MKYLKQTAEAIAKLHFKMLIVIVTNTRNTEEIGAIKKVCPWLPNAEVAIAKFPHLYHPWILTWCHKEIMLNAYKSGRFMYYLLVEDDIEVSQAAITRWLEHRERLRHTKFFPSFIRIEYSEPKKTWVSTDIKSPIDLHSLPRLIMKDSDFDYVNLPNPYQAMFFYDQELMSEHINSDTFDYKKYGKFDDLDKYPGWGGGGVAERANHGIIFHKVPDGFFSRNLLPILKKSKSIDESIILKHADPIWLKWGAQGFGALPVQDLITR